MVNGCIVVENLLNKNLFDKLLNSLEGNILFLCFVISISLLVFIAISYVYDPIFANKLTGIVFTNLFIGRVPALSLGYASHLSHFTVIGINVITEMILVTFFYSIFLFSYKGILKIEAFESFFLKIEEKQKLHKEKFNKYGKWGLFLFVFMPFWMTGPIVGAIIGFLIGMKHHVVIITVFLATVVSISLWGIFLQEIIDFVVKFDARLIWVFLFFIIVAITILRLRKRD